MARMVRQRKAFGKTPSRISARLDVFVGRRGTTASRPRSVAGAWALLTVLLALSYLRVREGALRCSVNWSEYGAGPGCVEQTSRVPWMEVSGKTYRDFTSYFADQDVLHLDLLIRPSVPGGTPDAPFDWDTLREAAQLDLRLRGEPLAPPLGYGQLCFRPPIRGIQDACPPTSVFGLAGVLPEDVALVGDAGWTHYVGCTERLAASRGGNWGQGRHAQTVRMLRFSYR
ncbi:hypothetical protein T492DRAFT_865243, partial [Pavlovales sp. CCMP2436]